MRLTRLKMFFNLSQTHSQDCTSIVEAEPKIMVDNDAATKYQPLIRFVDEDHEFTEADTACLEELALVLYQPLRRIPVRRFYITPDGVAYEIVDGLVVGRRPRRSTKQRPRTSKALPASLALVPYRQPPVSRHCRFYATPTGATYSVVEASMDVTGLDDLPVALYRPLCIPLPVGYRKFYVTAAGVAYEIVGRPMPKRRTRRGKKKRALQLEVDGENKENEQNGTNAVPKEKVRVQQPKTPWSRRWCSAQAKKTLSVTNAIGSSSLGAVEYQ